MDLIIAKLATILHPYSGLISQSTTYLALLQIVTPAMTLNSIRKSKNGSNIPIIPFLFIAIFTVLNLFHSKIRNDEALFNSNLVGFSLAAIYLTVYFLISPASKQMENLISIASGVTFCSLIYFYTQYENPAKLEHRFENILTSVLCSFHFVAFLGTLKALGDKNSGHLPFEMIASGILMNINRVCFGILANNKFVLIQYFIFLLVNLSQLFCILIYPRDAIVKKTTTKKTENKSKSSAKKSKKE
ncbi:hypothetical protein PVAND_014687 [Polypedilum vanderplanki]|uniref:Sugar transporter SWEET n=1 Tax=Polypedilum vanderplanki TaxID=319348 RepID=A0A9J6BAR1_POLVA|nr:hypothetical protein PVAND_014687 [Polypedilum vanderplanki]